MARRGMSFGVFLAPFHALGENPTVAMARDMELIEWLDHLGYDEAWIGEHHSAGWEIIAAPGDLHRRGAGAHEAHQAGIGRHLPALPPPDAGGAALRAARPYEPGADHARLRAGRAGDRCLHDGHQADRPAPADDGGAGGDHRAAGMRRAGDDGDRLVHAPRGAAASGALDRGTLPDRRRLHHHPLRHDGRRAPRHRRALHRRRHSGRTRDAGEAVADRRRRGREARQDDGPQGLARGRQHAPRGG